MILVPYGFSCISKKVVLVATTEPSVYDSPLLPYLILAIFLVVLEFVFILAMMSSVNSLDSYGNIVIKDNQDTHIRCDKLVEENTKLQERIKELERDLRHAHNDVDALRRETDEW